jgi:GxxExxY protein
MVRNCAFKVYTTLGPGLLESVYVMAMKHELTACGLSVQTEVAMPLIYKGSRSECGYRLDMVVENKVVLEIKSVELLHEVHHKQVITYLRLSGHKLALLINFNVGDLAKGIFRKVNGL